MGETTTIAWTDKTYNPWIGCQQVTEQECGDCYALRYGMEVWGSLHGSNRHLTKTANDLRIRQFPTPTIDGMEARACS